MLSSKVESRTQPSRLMPRTQKKFEAKDRLLEDRPFRGQKQEWSRPKTQGATVLQKKSPQKKIFAREDAKFPQKIRRSQKKRSPLQIFREVSAVFHGKVNKRSWPWPIFNKSKKGLGLVGFEAKAKDFKMCPRGLHLWLPLPYTIFFVVLLLF